MVPTVSTDMFAVPVGFLKTNFGHKSNGIISACIFFPLGIPFFFPQQMVIYGSYMCQSYSVDKA